MFSTYGAGRHPEIPTRKLYAAFFKDGIYYIIMERITGDPLSALWEGLTPGEQEQVMLRLLEHLQALRSIPSQGYYRQVHYRGFDPAFLLLQLEQRRILCPYNSYEELASAFSQAAWLRASMAIDTPTFLPEEMEALQGHEDELLQTRSPQLVLTHIDSSHYNIIVRRREDNFDLVLVDLEGLAWLPAWMQPLYCLHRSLWDGKRRSCFVEAMAKSFGDSFEEDIQYNKYNEWVMYPL